MEGILKVTPSVLRNKAGEFESVRGSVMSLIDTMTAKVNGLSSTWQSEAYTAYKNAYAGLEDDIQRLNRMISEHVKDLNEIAELYDKADVEAQNVAGGLPRDAIK